MRKILILTYFLITVFTINSIAQDFWERVILPDSVVPLSLDFNSQGHIYLLSLNSLHKSLDEGETWQNLGLTLYDSYNKDIAIKLDNKIYVGVDPWGRFYYSNNDGLLWDTIFTNIQGMIVLFLTNYDNILLAGTWGGLYKSSDSGYTWTQVLSTVNSEVFNDIIEKDSMLFAGSVNWIGPNAGGVYRSFDQGDTWELSGMIDHGIYSFAIDIDSNLLAGVHVAPFSSSPGIYRCTDQGIIWENIYNQAYIGPVVVDPFGGIYAGLSATMGNPGWGIRFSDDNGITWTNLSSGMQYCIGVTDLAISPANYIYAATYYPNHLYRSINPIVGINESKIKDKKHNIHVYPNPCDDRLFIKLEKEPSTNIIVEIFDFAGNSLIIWKYFEINNKEIQIDIKNFSAGIYFLKVNNEDISETFKIIKN